MDMRNDNSLTTILTVDVTEWLTRTDASKNWNIHEYYLPRILARVSQVSPGEFSPEISDDHMLLGDEGER